MVISGHKNRLQQFGLPQLLLRCVAPPVGYCANDEARTLLLCSVLIDAGRRAGERTKPKALGHDMLMGEDMVAIVPRPPSALSQFHIKCD